MNTYFWQSFIQPERRLHIRDTVAEMLTISALLYGGMAIGGIVTLNLPIWQGIDKATIYIVCIMAILMSLGFFACRDRTPLWLVVIHVPLGIIMLSEIVYASHAPQSIGIAVTYIVGSTYTFHYFTRRAATSLLLLTLPTLAYALYANDIEGWSAAVFFIGVCSLINGEIARITASRINHLATRDKLTGLLNRNTIESIIEDMLHHRKLPFSIILFDLNGFKAINDVHGHLVGDEILVKVARAMKVATPKRSGYAARWGGDEFIILLYGDDADNTDVVASRISHSLDGAVGFESGITQARQDDGLDDLILRADNSMYTKKRNRRATDIAVA